MAGGLAVSDRVGERSRVGEADLDGGRGVGSSTLGVTVTLGASDRVGVGSPPPPPVPHPASAPRVMIAAATTATRMVLPPPERRPSPALHDKLVRWWGG